MNFNIASYIPESVKNFLAGNRTYIIGWTSVALAILSLGGLDMSSYGITPENQVQLLVTGLSAVFIRSGITNEVKKLDK